MTSTTTTTTLTTLKLCWIQSTSVTGAMRCRRKREIQNRYVNEIISKMLSLLTGVFRIIIDNIENSPAALINPNPSAVGLAEDSLDREDQEDIAEEDELSSSMDERKPKFLNYWMTRTKTMTITSYSTPSTFGSLICTPTSFQYGPCPCSGWIGK